MIQVNNINLSFGQQIIFENISFLFNKNQRIGLVGLNGTGKSTLLKVLAKSQRVDDGIITIPKDFTIAYMPQEVILASEKSILEEAFSAFEKVYFLKNEVIELEKKINNDNSDIQALEKYSIITQELNDLGPERLLAQAKKILVGLGFKETQFEEPVSNLSVGWKMRIVLAKLLLQQADFYLFDEPTNHLDIVAKEWFMNFLKNSSFGFIIVCHERYFLNKLCTHIYELEFGKGILYTGNYNKYEAQKQEIIERQEKAYEEQQKEIKRKQELIDRFRAKASKAKMAQSIAKQLDKIEVIELTRNSKSINIKLKPTVKPGRIVLTVKNLSYSFENKSVLKNINFEIERGDKIAIIAPNGIGKTTLLNIICSKYQKQQGSFDFGHNVNYAFFEQDQNRALNFNNTIFEEIRNNCANKTEAEIRNLLGCFLFTGDDVNKKIKVLSGGEKNRVSLVRALLQDANLLILDEPTNHLDIQSKDILLNALSQYDGTILFVSHDHDFVNKLSTKIIELTSEGSKLFLGNYEGYLSQKEFINNNNKNEKTEIITKNNLQTSTSKINHDLKKQCKKLENKIAKLEKDIKDTQNGFANLLYGTLEFKKQQEILEKLQNEHTQAFLEWEIIMASIESE